MQLLRTLSILIVSTLPACRSPSIEPAGSHFDLGGSLPEHRVHARLGVREMRSSSWFLASHQSAVAAEYSWQPNSTGLGMSAGLSLAEGRSTLALFGPPIDLRARSYELYAGPRVASDLGLTWLELFAGAGPTLLHAQFDVEDDTESSAADDLTVGGFVQGGVLLSLGSLQLGLDARAVLGTSLEVFGDSGADADYAQVTLTLGIGL